MGLGAGVLGGVERASVGVDGEASQDDAFGLGEQVPAPVDDGAQGALAGRGAALLGGQEVVLEAFGEGVGAEGSGSGGGQLDGQRDAVEVGDEGCGVAGGEAGGAGEEELGGGGGVERRDGPGVLAGDGEGLPAGGEDAEGGDAAQQRGAEVGGRLDEVLAVVEDEERGVAGVERGGEIGRVGQAQGPGRRPGRGRRCRPARRGGALGWARAASIASPGLADASRPGEGDES
ncbi:hypothetical protein GCM10020219_008890 [Nonomuraea dietziae]